MVEWFFRRRKKRMSHKTAAKAAAVVLALAVLTSAARAEAAELTDAQMDQITAGAFLVVGGLPPGGLGSLQDSSNNLYIRQTVPTQYLVGTVLWEGNITYFPGNPPYAVGTLIGPAGTAPRDGGFTVPTI
jgi:hypothetical protein